MNAKQALALSQENEKSSIKYFLDQIESEAKKGKTKVFLSKQADESQIEQLKELGYKVEPGFDRNEYYVSIDWSKANGLLPIPENIPRHL